ncbi:monovalent cation/H(+) antiporter subunit G [Euzebya sp.]|uniref:monovalent cation/H(+) antiporter subunit G n=1 Tax=Euzebya sp. TaxID=1971409 RepID=UPI00351950BB
MMVLAALLILTGSCLALLAAAGLFRLPEVYGRMHAATKPAVLGLVLMLVGAAIELGDASATVRLLLAAALQMFTAPVAMHAVGRAVGRSWVARSSDLSWPPPDGAAPGQVP